MAIYTSLLNEAAVGTAANNNYDLYQFGIDLERADLAMFESLIQLDMVEVCNENGLISLTEEEKEAANKVAKEGIIDKIKALFDKFIMAASNFIKKVILKIRELIKADENLVIKFKSKFTKENIKKCNLSGIKVINHDVFTQNVEEADKMWQTAAYAFNNSTASTVDEVKAEKAKLDKYLTGDALKEAIMKDAVITVEGPLTGATDVAIKNIEESLNDLRSNASNLAAIKMAEISLSTAKKSSANQIREMKRDDSISKEVLNAKYDYNKAFVSKFSQYVNISMSTAFEMIKTSRACVVKVGNWILKNASDDKKAPAADTTTESYYYALEEMSNMYVDEALSLV